MRNFGAGKRHFCRKRERDFFSRKKESRFETQGWKFAAWTRCCDGHPEEVFTNTNHPNLLLHKNCCGSWSLAPGVVVEEVIVKKVAKFFYID